MKLIDGNSIEQAGGESQGVSDLHEVSDPSPISAVEEQSTSQHVPEPAVDAHIISGPVPPKARSGPPSVKWPPSLLPLQEPLGVVDGTDAFAVIAECDHCHSKSESELSARQSEVLRMASEGASNVEIAKALYLSLGTVKAHMRAILAKLDANDRTHAAVIAVRNGWLELEA